MDVVIVLVAVGEEKVDIYSWKDARAGSVEAGSSVMIVPLSSLSAVLVRVVCCVFVARTVTVENVVGSEAALALA